MSSGQASTIAKHGLSYLLTATKASVDAISSGITTVRKKYVDHQAREQLNLLKKSGKPAQEILFLVFQRFYYLSLAGYKNEVSAAARKCATRIVDPESSVLPIDGVLSLGNNLLGVSQRFGDIGKSMTTLQNLQDYLNLGRMGKDHYDRDNLSSDFYYALVYLSETYGGMNFDFQEAVKNAALKLVNFSSNTSNQSSYVSPILNSNMTLPDYATIPSSSSSVPLSSTALPADDPQSKAARVIYFIAISISKIAEETELKRQKRFREAEQIMKSEEQSRVKY